MKRTMHLYETHLPVKDTEVSSGFYVDVVGLEYAHRDLTRDVVFLWIGSKKRSMLGLWGPTTPWGQSHRCHFAVALALSDLLAAGSRLSSLGVVTRDFSGKITTEPSVIGWMPSAQIYFSDPDGHTVEYITLLDEAPECEFVGSLSAWKARQKMVQPRRKNYGLAFESCSASRVGCNPAHELAVLRGRQPATTGTRIVG